MVIVVAVATVVAVLLVVAAPMSGAVLAVRRSRQSMQVVMGVASLETVTEMVMETAAV